MSETIGKSIPRVDVLDKCGGSAKYVDDMKFDNMLYAKTLRSTRPRAKILSLEIPALPDGYYIIDRNDVPGRNRVRILIYDQPFFAEDVVNYIGEPILLVVGADKAKILDIISQIEVHYEDLEPILSIEDAESGDKEPIFGEDNRFVDYEYSKGDPDKAFAASATIIENEYRTGYQEQLYLEPHGVIGVFRDGKVTVYGCMQCPFYARNAVIEGLGWDEERVQIIQTTTGGAFGGKEEYPSLICGQAAFAAVKTGHPVKLIFERTEDIEVTTKRHPSIVKHRTAFDAAGNILAMDVDIKFDGGAYAGLSDVVLQRGMFCAVGAYDIPNLRIGGRAFATNTVPCGAFRGFGAPQAFFAVEMQMQNIADKLGIDPIDFKLRYALKKGDTTSTGGILRDEIKIPEIMRTIDDMSNFRDKFQKYENESGNIRHGIGFSLFFHGCGFTGNGENIISGKITLRKSSDGAVEILISNTEMGQGALTALRKIVAKTLNIPIEDVIYENPDTDRVPDSGPTVASRTTVIVGGLLEIAAAELKERWHESGEIEISKVYKHPDYITWDQKSLHGDAYPTYSWGANVVEVEIDTITCEITLKKVWAVFDVGMAIDEKMLRGQIEGGIAQGLGYGNIEVMNSNDGKIQQNSITDYMIPTASDLPEIESQLIDNPYPYGPFGAKCAGELTLVGAGIALASAVQNALGSQIYKIPVRPEDLLEEFENGN